MNYISQFKELLWKFMLCLVYHDYQSTENYYKDYRSVPMNTSLSKILEKTLIKYHEFGKLFTWKTC